MTCPKCGRTFNTTTAKNICLNSYTTFRVKDPKNNEVNIRGVREASCPRPHCDGIIPGDALVCPECFYKRKFNPEQYNLLRRSSTDPWNAWRLRSPKTEIQLGAADLEQAYLFRVRLDGANLRYANLSGAQLKSAPYMFLTEVIFTLVSLICVF